MEGYDAKFEPPLDKRLECPICLLAQRDPLQTPCGHRFCAACILRALRETGPRCPVDNTSMSNTQLFKDNFAKREVLSLNVKCSAVELGCIWNGELRDLESHICTCELVCINCPNCCGHSCQRKDLRPHIDLCVNKPEQCPHCSIHFTRDKVEEHLVHCSMIILPESLLSNLFKANEVLKWTGHIKLKMNKMCASLFSQIGGGQGSCQITGYLTAKAESAEAHMFSGNWLSSMTVAPLDTPRSRIFMRTLHGPEVQSKVFTFALLSNDVKAKIFTRILKHKFNDISALFGMNLMTSVSRTNLTIIYLHWSEQKKRIVAYVADLKSHLVKHLQSHLQSVQGSNSRRGRTMVINPVESRAHPRILPHTSTFRHSDYALHQLHQQQQRFPSQAPPPPPGAPPPPGSFPIPPPPPTLPPGHMQQQHHHQQMHAHIHPRQPTSALGVITSPPSTLSRQLQQQQARQTFHPMHSSQLFQETPAQPYPRILSWQMSQSLNGYPWRVHHDNVPFFTFPSTPPSFLPSNSYPYTFAPPISINQITPGPNPVPSYAGIPIPTVTGVDSVVTGPVGATFPVAALTSLTEVPGEPLHNGPPGTVGVTISSGSHPVTGQTVVIQRPIVHQQAREVGIPNPDMAVYHTVSHPPPPPPAHPHHAHHIHHGHAHYTPSQLPPHIAPAIIVGDSTQPASVIQHGPLVTALPPPQLISVGGPHHGVMGVSLAHNISPLDANPNQARVSQIPSAVSLNHDRRYGPVPSDSAVSSSNLSPHYPSSDVESGSAGIRSILARSSANNATVAMLDDGGGPSSVTADTASSDNDSLESNSPGTQFAAILYNGHHFPRYENDSDDYSAVELESGDSVSYRHGRQMSDSSRDGHILTSDPDDSSGISDSDSDVLANPSTLRMINTSSEIVNLPSSSSVNVEAASSSEDQSSSLYVSNETNPGNVSEADMRPLGDEENMSLPPLISINSDSDTAISQAPTPSSVIDLTVSSANSSPSLSELSVSPQRSSTLRDPRIFRDGSSCIISSNLFRESASNEVSVPGVSNMAENNLDRHTFVMTSASDRDPAIGGVSSQSCDFHHSSHSVVQLAQPHPHQQYVALQQQQLQQQIHQQLQQQQHALLHGHNVIHPHANTEQTTQSMFPFPSHLVHGGDNSSVSVPQVSTPTHPSPSPSVAAAAALPLDPSSSVNQHDVHVLAWQQHLAAGELVPSHPLQPPTATLAAVAVALPPPPPSMGGHGPPLADAVLTTHHRMQTARREEVDAVATAAALNLQPQLPPPPVGRGGAQTVVTGNFWETVMPSLDLSLQSNATTSTEASTHQ